MDWTALLGGVALGAAGAALLTQGPSMLGQGPVQGPPEEDEDEGPHRLVSVDRVVHGPGGAGGGFFGVSASPWLYPLHAAPLFLEPPRRPIVCEEVTTAHGEDLILCRRKYPVQRVAYVAPTVAWF